MTRSRFSFAVFAILLWSAPLFAQSANMLTAQEKAQGWQLLFDGKTVKGWHSAPPAAPPAGRADRGRAAPAAPAPGPAGAGRAAAPAPGQTGTPKPCVGAKGDAAVAAPAGSSHWEVVDGALTGCGSPAGYLNSDQSFKNFVLSLEFK